MGAFLLGLIIGVVIALLIFVYDEGKVFLKLSDQIKRLGDQVKAVAERYKQQRAG